VDVELVGVSDGLERSVGQASWFLACGSLDLEDGSLHLALLPVAGMQAGKDEYLHAQSCLLDQERSPRRECRPLLVEEARLVKAPGGSVVQVEVAIGAKVLSGKELSVCPGNQVHELPICKFVELFGPNRLPDPESSRFHGCSMPRVR
jgi:hypothetical protein